MKPKLRIFSNLARTGGTLVSRCLACMEGKALVSEIHPYGHRVSDTFNILKQAQGWYQLFKSDELVNKNYSFSEITLLISQAMEKRGFTFIIRDWVHLDFMAVPFVKAPYYKSRLVEVLENDFDIVQYHLVRHPVPQWFSTDKLAIIHGKLSLEQYLKGCFHYAELCNKNGFVRYEDFCEQPEKVMQDICAHLEFDYDPQFIKKWPDHTRITGDNVKGTPNREIRPAKLPVVDADLNRQLHDCDYYHKTLSLLGYDDVMVK